MNDQQNTANDKPANQSDWLDRLLCIGVPYMNEQWASYPKDQEHMLAGFKHTHGFKEAKAAIQAKIDEAVLAGRKDAATHVYNVAHDILADKKIPRHEALKYFKDRIAELQLKNGDKGNELV